MTYRGFVADISDGQIDKTSNGSHSHNSASGLVRQHPDDLFHLFKVITQCAPFFVLDIFGCCQRRVTWVAPNRDIRRPDILALLAVSRMEIYLTLQPLDEAMDECGLHIRHKASQPVLETIYKAGHHCPVFFRTFLCPLWPSLEV